MGRCYRRWNQLAVARSTRNIACRPSRLLATANSEFAPELPSLLNVAVPGTEQNSRAHQVWVGLRAVTASLCLV